MASHLFLQSVIFTKFALPFLLIFFIVFAILEKTKVFGEDKKQINALVAFIIGLIFVGAAFPKEVVENLILFLTVAIVIVFIILLLWGFVSGGELKIESTGLRWALGIVVVVAVIIAVLWAIGIQGGVIYLLFDLLFYQTWSGTFWTNVLFIVVIAAALALVLKGTKSS